jgi:hypothetical protein
MDDGDTAGELAVLARPDMATDAPRTEQSQSLVDVGAAARPKEKGAVMKYWWRELSGWLLIGLSMLAFALVYDFCDKRRMTEAWPIAVIALVIFWGGIQLLKVAIAARICQQAQDRLYPARNDKVTR